MKLKIFSILVVFLFLVSCSSINVKKNSIPSREEQEQVLNKALKWIIDNPATFKEGGFLEMGEEINLFYVIYERTKSDQMKKLCRQRIERIVNDLRKEENFVIRFPGEIAAYLAIAKVAKRLGFKIADFEKFIQKQILFNPMTYPPSITYLILNSAFLRDLDYTPRVPMEKSIGEGVIAKMTQNNHLIPIGKDYASDKDVTNFFYDITHEIFALSSFGDKNPQQMLMPREIEFVKKILKKGFSIYLPKKQLDILCELVVCAKMMDYADFPEFNETINFILSSQKEDGTFGLIPRMKDLGRGNLYRHGILVAVWALTS